MDFQPPPGLPFEALAEQSMSGPVPVPAATAVPATVTTPSAPAYRDRSTGLMVFGVLQIVLGLLSALMVPFVALGAFLSRLGPAGAMRPGQYVAGVASYAFIAAALITLGIGSMQMKRWARALTLVTSWYWLIMGTLITVLMTAVLPVSMRGALAQVRQNAEAAPAPAFSTGVMAVILTIIIVFATFFLVLVPLAFVIFYSRKDVGETCRQRDPVERWTERTPLPVLGASMVLLIGALYMLLIGVTAPMFPFFGQYLGGIAGAACFVVLAALDTYLAVALFRLQPAGWWIAIFTLPIRVLSMAITYTRADLMQAYSKMGLSDAQLQMLNSNPIIHSRIILWWSLISLAGFFGYLVWLKRYFKMPAAPEAEASPLPAGSEL